MRGKIWQTLTAVAFVSGCNASSLDDLDMAKPDAAPIVLGGHDMAMPGLPRRAPTDHPALSPLDYHGGEVIKAMEMWVVVWQGDEALGQKVQTFASWMLSSQYWADGVSEYGVGPGQVMGVIVLPHAAPQNLPDTSLPGIVAEALGTTITPNANTVLAFLVPPSTQSTLGDGSFGCQDYGGYHSEAFISGLHLPYLINLQCEGFRGQVNFDGLTEVISHEAAEAATDPHPFTHPGYVSYWQPLGGENADLCSGLGLTYDVTLDVPDAGTTDASYYVTRLWSNKAVTAGNEDPCQPAPSGQPYFNVAIDPQQIDADVGTTVTATIEPFSFGNVGQIRWTLLEQPGSGIRLSPESGIGTAGDTFNLTVTVSDTAYSGLYPVLLSVRSRVGENQWMGSVYIP